MSAVLFVVMAAALWGTTGTAQELGPAGTTPAAVGLVRVAVGAVGLMVLARRSGARPRSVGAVRDRPWWVATLVGAVATALYQLSFFVGVDRLGVAVGTLVGIGSAPLFTGLGAQLVGRDKAQLVWVLRAAPLPIVGAVLLLLGGGGDVAFDPLGLVAALGAGASYAAYTIAARQLLDAGEGSIGVMARLFGIAAVLLVAGVGATRPDMGWLLEPRGMVLAAWLGLGTVTLAYVLFGRGLREVAPARVATLTLTEPTVAALLGVAVLGESLDLIQLAGVAVVATGLVWAGRHPIPTEVPA